MQLAINSKLTNITLSLCLLFVLSNCTTQNSNNNKQTTHIKPEVVVQAEKSTPAFPLPDIPVMIVDPKEEINYLIKHYWDLFPFNDTNLIAQPDITEQGLVDYLQLLSNTPYSKAENSLKIMLNKAKEEPAMYAHFASLFEKYLYDPNSPFRDDELYIPIVAHLLQSGMLPEEKQSVYRFQQEMILKNRVGTTATDFIYTLANGEKKSMHALQSNYLILFFTNPDCPSCAVTTEQLVNSKALQGIFSLNSATSKMLTVLSIYPDSNIDEWRKLLPNMPQKNWINAYDDGTVITNKRLYDIKAIPTLYLLDKNKQVILKDTTLDAIEEFFMKVR